MLPIIPPSVQRLCVEGSGPKVRPCGRGGSRRRSRTHRAGRRAVRASGSIDTIRFMCRVKSSTTPDAGGLSGDRRAGAARDHRDPVLAADGQRRGHVVRVPRRDDAERHPPVVGGVHGEQRPRCGVELDLAAGYGLPQCSGQVTRLRLRHLLLLLVPVLRPARTRRGVPRCIACLCHGSSVHADRPRTAPPRGRAAAARHGAPNIRTGPASSVRRPRSAACPRAVRLFGAGMYTRCMDCTRSVSGRLPVTSHGLCPVVPRDVAHGSHAADAGPRARKNGCRALHGHG